MSISANRRLSLPVFRPASAAKTGRFFGALAGLILTFAGATQWLRAETWTDATGQRTVEAEFIGVKAGEVYLKRKSDGVTFQVPFNRLSAASQQLARQLHAAAAGPKPDVSGGDNPEAVIQAYLEAMETGNVRALWDLLPPSYQKDVNGLIHTFAADMDADLWKAGLDVMQKVLRVWEKKKTFLLDNPDMARWAAGLPPNLYDLQVDFGKVVLTSELTDLSKLKTLDVGQFLDGSGKKIVEHKIHSLFQNQTQLEMGLGVERKFRTLRQDAVTATVRVRSLGERTREMEWVRVDGRWLPKAEVADAWAAAMAGRGDQRTKMIGQLEEHNEEMLASLKVLAGLAAVAQRKEHKVDTLAGLAAADKIVERMLTAPTQAAFNDAADALKDTVQKAFPEGLLAPVVQPLLGPRAPVPPEQLDDQPGLVTSGSPAEAAAVEKITKLGGRVDYDSQAAGRPVVEVDLSHRQATDADLEHVKGLPHLRTLNLSRTQISDAGVERLRGLTQLQELNLSETAVTNGGLQHLKRLTQLERLALPGTQVTGAGLVHLQGLAKLQCLELSPTAWTDASLKELKGFNQLETLDLGNTQVTDAGLVHLKALTELEELNLENTQVTDAGLVHLQGLSQLAELQLQRTRITGTGLVHLRGLARLQKLILASTQITDAGLEHLQKLPRLRILVLTDTPITDAGLTRLQGLTKLRALDLSATQVTDAGIQGLQRALPRLMIMGAPRRDPASVKTWSTETATAELEKQGARVLRDETLPGRPVISVDLNDRRLLEEVGLKPLQVLPQLQTLMLRQCYPVTDAELEHLRGLTQLRILHLGSTKVTDAGLAQLAGLTQLEKLVLEGLPVTDAGLERLKGLTKLKELDLSGAMVTDAGLQHLEGLTELRTLNLGNTQVTDAGLVRLKKLPQLETLRLSFAKVTDAGLPHLKGLRQLQSLCLYKTQVTDAGLVHLQGLTQLRELDLRYAPVTDAGLVHLKGLPKLRTLMLEKTAATEAGVMMNGRSGGSAEDKPAENDRRVTLAEGKIVLDAPKSWVRREPKTKMIEHEFAIPSGQDEKPEGRFTAMGAGGGVEANITRWLGQFVQTDGSATKDKAKVEQRRIAGLEVHYVDVAGDFKDSAVMRPDYRMLGAIIVTEKTTLHFLKFYGPKELVAANKQAFEEMLNSLRLK